MSVKRVKKTASDIQHKDSKETCKALLAFTPLLVLIIVCCIMVLVGYKKFLYIKGYADMAFSNKNVGEMSADNPYKRADAVPMTGEIEVPVVKESEEDTKPETETHEIVFPYYGDAYATLTIDNENVGVKDTPVFWGDSDDLLEKGVVQSNYSSYIGIPGRVVLAAHNHTFFAYFKNIQVGDRATLTTEYGKFVYEVKKIEIRQDTDTELLYYDPTAEEVTDDLIMYTCWNNGYMGTSDKRLYAICELVSREYTN
ncbi:MAG: class D sortase [Hominimerdicola sp.]